MSDNKDISLRMRILSFFDGKGTADAKAQLDATAKSAEQVGDTSQKAGKDINSGFGKAGSGVAEISKRISALQRIVTGFGIIGIIGAITTAYNLLKKVSDWISDKMTASIRAAGEASQKTADSLSDYKMKLAQEMVDNVATSYDRTASAINSATTAQQQYLSALQDLNAAQQEATALELDRRELAALATVKDGDAAGEAAVKARYAKMRLADSLGQRGSQAIRSEQFANDELDAAAARRAEAERSLSTAKQHRSTLADQLEYTAAQVKQHPDTDKPGFRGDWAKRQNENAQKELEVFTTEITKLDSTILKLTDVLASQTAIERAAGIRLQAARVRSGPVMEAATSLSQQQSSDIDRSTRKITAKQTQAAQEQQQAAAESRAALTRKVLSAQSNLRSARNSGGDRDSVAQLKAALDKALADRATADRLLLDHARKTSEQANRTAEAVKNLPNN